MILNEQKVSTLSALTFRTYIKPRLSVTSAIQCIYHCNNIVSFNLLQVYFEIYLGHDKDKVYIYMYMLKVSTRVLELGSIDL